jgi:succinate-semialdehyde dehydrogenase/glutarate-semialdehyde dehydrogenase
MELGAHPPVIITKGADIDAAATALVAAKYSNCGQVCVSPTRFMIDESVFDVYPASFIDRVKSIVARNGMESGTKMGPLNNVRRLESVQRLIDDAKLRGVSVAAGGASIEGKSLFFEPTVVIEPPHNCLLMNEEPFGPIVILSRYCNLEDAINEANRLPYGLAAYAFSDSANDIARITSGVETGMLGINHTAISFVETPFGGVKDSGYGSDGGLEAMRGYLQPELVTIATREQSPSD